MEKLNLMKEAMRTSCLDYLIFSRRSVEPILVMKALDLQVRDWFTWTAMAVEAK